MSVKLVASETFEYYPDVARFVTQQNIEGKACLVTNCNDGFLVDVYEELID